MVRGEPIRRADEGVATAQNAAPCGAASEVEPGGFEPPVPKQSASRVYMHSHQLNLGLITAR